MTNCGIYRLVNIINGKIYIGSSKKLDNRKYSHFQELRIGKHGNKKLQHAYNKYGESAFKFFVVELCNLEDLIEREQFWIDYLDVTKKGYNICAKAGRPPLLSAAQLKKMSIQRKGKKKEPFSKEWKLKLKIAAQKPRPSQSISIKKIWDSKGDRKIDLVCSSCGKIKKTNPSDSQLNFKKYKCRPCYLLSHRLPLQPSHVAVICPCCNVDRLLSLDHTRRKRSMTCYKCSLKSRKVPKKWHSQEAYDKMMATFATPEFKKRKSEATKLAWQRKKARSLELMVTT